jgi:ribosomal protein L17
MAERSISVVRDDAPVISEPAPMPMGIAGRTDPVQYLVEFEAAKKIGDYIFKSGLAPAGVRNGEAAAIIILTGYELGLTWMQSLRTIHVINNRPVLSADMMAACVKRFCAQRGGGFIRPREATDTACTVDFQRHDDPEPQSVTYTIEDAKQADLIKPGGNWIKHPKAMLKARALSIAARTGWPDVLAGVYDPSEMQEAVYEVRESSPAKVTATATVRTRPATRSAPEATAGEIIEAEIVDATATPAKEIPAAKKAAVDELIKLAAKATVNEQDLVLIAWHQFQVQALEDLDGKGIFTLTKLLQKPEGEVADAVFAARDALAAYGSPQAEES